MVVNLGPIYLVHIVAQGYKIKIGQSSSDGEIYIKEIVGLWVSSTWI